MTTENQIPDNIRQQVITLEQDMALTHKEAGEAAKKSERYQEDAKAFRETSMGFWDRNFWGWFGNKEKIRSYKSMKSLTDEFNTKAADLRSKASGLDAQADSVVESFLKTSDPHFQRVHKCNEAARNMSSEVNGFKSLIGAAKSGIGSATGIEIVDLFSDSKAVSLLSYMANDDANDAIRRVSSAVPAFQRALQGYNVAVKDFDTAARGLTGVNDGIDLVIDVVFDGFDFMSLFTLAKLAEARSNMDELSRKVDEVDAIVGRNVAKTGSYLKSYKKDVRATCLRQG